ncbi:MAG TPA: sugar transferase [Acidimicrobiales bacterium]|nr:sugar transferase [Acidimicrobiales bacterium]
MSGTGVAPHVPTPAARAANGAARSGEPARARRRDRSAAPASLTYVVIDLAAVATALLIAHLLRFGFSSPTLKGTDVPYVVVAALAVPVWIGVMALAGCYDRRILGVGSEEYHRVLNGGVHFLAVVAVLHFLGSVVIARGFVGVLIPVAVVLTLLARYWLRSWLYKRRRAGHYVHPTLLVGSPTTVVDVGEHLVRSGWQGFTIVGACVDTDERQLHVYEQPVPVVGGIDDIAAALARCGADSVAITDESLPVDLPTLAEAVDRAGASLLVAPAIADVAGPRTVVQPVAGLPLLHVKQPAFAGPQRLVKAVIDRSVGALGLMLLMPVIVGVAVAIKIDDPGPVFFKQVRVGRDGRRFTMVKFRTMVVDAEKLLAHLEEHNETGGVLFKIREDPRITRVGRRLRRYSIDEIPQLWNLLKGEMSLVGPRPPLPSEVELYEHHVNRRLMVKPGLTGLWQVSGRSDLSWDEAVRLDLYYVDHWSPTMDVMIVLKTFSAVTRAAGAY